MNTSSKHSKTKWTEDGKNYNLDAQNKKDRMIMYLRRREESLRFLSRYIDHAQVVRENRGSITMFLKCIKKKL